MQMLFAFLRLRSLVSCVLSISHIVSCLIVHINPHTVSCFSASDIAQVDVLQAFFEERKLNGDFISKACDMLWQREVLISEDASDERFTDTSQEVLVQQLQYILCFQFRYSILWDCICMISSHRKQIN